MPYYSGDVAVGDYYLGDPGRKRKGRKRGGKVPGKGGGKGRLRRGAGAAVEVLGGLLEAGAGGGRRARGARGGRRRMHVTNVKALRRAMRRVKGFAHLAQKTIGFTKRVKMKTRRRK